MPKIPPVKFREIAKALEKAGFIHIRTKGSHFYYRHPQTKATVSVPNHGPKILGKGLVKGVLNDAGIAVEDFVKLLKR